MSQIGTFVNEERIKFYHFPHVGKMVELGFGCQT